MGQSLKKVAKIVGIAALGFATAGIGFALLGGGTLFGAASVLGMTTGLTGALTLGNIIGLGALSLSLGSMPSKPIDDTGANDRGTAFTDPDAMGVYAFGTTTVPCALVYEEATGSSPDRVVHDVFAHAWHRINAYVSLTIGGDNGPEVVTFSGNAASGAHAGILWWFRALGNQVAALSGAPFDANGWPSTAIFTGVAHSAVVWNVDDDAFKNKYAAVPTKLDMIVEAAMLYDPRLDSAYGSGSQDYGTPSGWTFNNGNASLVLLRFLIGEKTAGGELIWGRGALETEIDMASFVAMANVADETLDGKPRFRLGGVHMLDGSFEGFVRRWEEETGGKLSKAGGVYRVWLPNDDLTPLTTLTDADLLAGQPVTHPVASGVEGLYNTARGRYIEPTQGYRAFPYPDVTEPSAITDDGGKRILYNDFSWVQDVSIAQRIARIKVRRSRFQRMWTIAIGWKGFGPNYRPFTVHTLNIKETGNNNEIVRVIHRDLDVQTGVAIVTMQQEDASIYDETLTLGTPFASNTIPNRVSQYSTLTPRYVDGTAVVRDSNWTPVLVGVERNGQQSYTKVAGGSAWNAAVHSVESYKRAMVAARVSQTNKNLMIGLSDAPTVTASFTDINHAIGADSSAILHIYESGVEIIPNAGSYAAGDDLAVIDDGVLARYYRNGQLLYASASNGLRKFADTSFFEVGASITDMTFSQLQSVGTPQMDPESATEVVTGTYSGPTTFTTDNNVLMTLSLTAPRAGPVQLTVTGDVSLASGVGTGQFLSRVVGSTFGTVEDSGPANTTSQRHAHTLSFDAVAGETITATVRANGLLVNTTIGNVNGRLEMIKA